MATTRKRYGWGLKRGVSLQLCSSPISKPFSVFSDIKTHPASLLSTEMLLACHSFALQKRWIISIFGMDNFIKANRVVTELVISFLMCVKLLGLESPLTPSTKFQFLLEECAKSLAAFLSSGCNRWLMTLIPCHQQEDAFKCQIRMMKKLTFIKNLLYSGAKWGSLCVSFHMVF